MRRNRVAMTVLAVLFLTVSALSANPKYYYHTDREYQLTKLICESANTVGPSVVTPVSGYSLLKSLSFVDRDALPPAVREKMDELIAELEGPKMLIDTESFKGTPFLTLTPLGFFDANPETDYWNSIVPVKDRPDFFLIGAEMMWSDFVYGECAVDYGRRYNQNHPPKVWDHGVIYDDSNMSQVIPDEAGVQFASDMFSLFVGRGGLNIGNGRTGNLFIADNFIYQDFMKISLDSDWFDYDFTLTHFDQQVSDTRFESWMTFNGKNQFRISHDYTVDIMHKAQLSLHAGSLLQVDQLDFRAFNPFILLHNWKGFSNDACWQNNIMSFELNTTLTHGFFLNAQFVIDQIQTSGEVGSGTDPNLLPNAFGASLALSNTTALKYGFLENWIEGVWTMPYLYLNVPMSFQKTPLVNPSTPDDPANYTTDKLNYDFILGYCVDYGGIGDISYTGYKYGPDTIVLALGGKYTPYSEKWDVSWEAMFKAHGERGIKFYESQTPETATGIEHLNEMPCTGTPEYLLQLVTTAHYTVTDYLKVKGVLGFQSFWNFQNQSGVSRQDVQGAVIATLDVVGAFTKLLGR